MEIIPSAEVRTALVHHWLVAARGGEKVLEALAEILPSADVFTLVYDRTKIPAGLQGRRIRSSPLQRLPHPTQWYPYYLPLFPLATTHLDLAGYDLIVSSDAAMIKGVRAAAGATHICYCHTPMRYLWNGDQAYRWTPGPMTAWAAAALRRRLCRWDYRAAQRVTHFVANSKHVQRRIRECYGRESTVIHPPVDTDDFTLGGGQPPENFFLLVSHLAPYKRADLVVAAFNRCGRPLVVIGDGPERRSLQRCARPNVRVLGPQPRRVVVEAMQRCRAFVFAGEEDFGIVLAEAQACGKPVVALGRGGALEIVIPGVSGVLFEEQSVESLLEGLDRFDRTRFDPVTVRGTALRFGRGRFLADFSRLLRELPPAGRKPL